MKVVTTISLSDDAIRLLKKMRRAKDKYVLSWAIEEKIKEDAKKRGIK